MLWLICIALPKDLQPKNMEEIKVVVKVDKREMRSGIKDYLINCGCVVEEEQLQIADYIVSDRVAIERKTYSDMISSIMDGRIFAQIKQLSDHFEKPIVLIEGFECFIGFNENALFGALSAIAIDFGVPTVWTKNKMESAKFICQAAKREQIETKRSVPVRVNKKGKNLREEQEILVSGLPTVNSVLSRRLLEKFGTPKKIFNATKEELMEVDGLGEKKAERFITLVDTEVCAEEKKENQKNTPDNA